MAELDPNDDVAVDKLFRSAYKNILINPMMSKIGDAARRLETRKKYALIQDYVKNGGGSLRLTQYGLVHVPKEYQNTGKMPPKAHFDDDTMPNELR